MLVYDYNGNFFFLFVVTCPLKKPRIICHINLYDDQTYPRYPEGQCTVDRCGQYRLDSLLIKMMSLINVVC